MATFNQQNQQVRHQVNADQAFVAGCPAHTWADVERMIGDLVRDVQSDRRIVDGAVAVVAQLNAARAAAGRNDRRSLVGYLARVGELAPSLAAIVTGFAAIANGINGPA
jgi:uncharacterized protein HemY